MTTREQLARIAAMAMIGTAWSGPNVITSTGISMIEEPKPTMPLSVPAIRPTTRTSRYSKSEHRERLRAGGRREQPVELDQLLFIQGDIQRAEVLPQALAVAGL